MAPSQLAQVLLEWYSRHGRDLPWRQTRDPYAIWLSEIILQQTRISQGTAYWERFMSEYPTVEALASASEDEVLKLWQGLGYYSRARNLHHAAKQLVHLGYFPKSLDEIRKLKGVGEYTAAAIAAFAFGNPVAAVDGNFYRVLARVFGIDTPINSTAGKKLFKALAEQVVTHPEVNAAIMDFGAMQCTPQNPGCVTCPIVDQCDAVRQGRVDELPVKLKTVKVKTRRMTYVYIRCNGQTAIRQRGKGDIWQGLWEPYLYADVMTANGDDDKKRKCLSKEKVFSISSTGFNSAWNPIALSVKHVLTHRVILSDFYLWEPERRPVLPAEYVWIDEQNLDNYAISRLFQLLLERLSIRDSATDAS